jgi:hypothetical protein
MTGLTDHPTGLQRFLLWLDYVSLLAMRRRQWERIKDQFPNLYRW